jgi:hypothetical protein
MMDIWLNDSWSLYFHDPLNDNWSHSGYQKIFTLSCISEFWMMFSQLSECLPNGMFFLMRDHIFPKWNDEENRNGGFLSIKILKDKMPSFCETLLLNLVNETLLKTEYQEHSDIINGVSFSPKKNFCIVKIWLKSTEIQDHTFFNIQEEYHGTILFKANTCMD